MVGDISTCYKASDSVTVSEIEITCESIGAIPAMPKQNTENLSRELSKLRGDATKVWIGLSWNDIDEEWMWADGTKIENFYWSLGEPNGNGSGKGVVLKNDGQWHDSNDDSYPVICQKPASLLRKYFVKP